MKTYKVLITADVTAYWHFEVEAESEADAKEQAKAEWEGDSGLNPSEVETDGVEPEITFR